MRALWAVAAIALLAPAARAITVDQIVESKRLIDDVATLKQRMDNLDMLDGDEVEGNIGTYTQWDCCTPLNRATVFVDRIPKATIRMVLQALLDADIKRLNELGVKCP